MTRKSQNTNKQRILLTNGRFPVTIDLARQLHRAGHTVFCVDPMEYHVCRFSTCVKKSYYIPAPHVDAEGYIKGVRKAIDESHIDLIIPMHEEIFFLAECNDEEILKRLLAPPFPTLITLHNKWEFIRFLARNGLEHPESHLIESMDDIRDKLDLDGKEWALKPVYGRAASNVYHLKPGQPLPDNVEGLSKECQYIAQEWVKGSRYCTYLIARGGKVQAFGLYAVEDTLDGSSCVYFEAIEHPGIRKYIETIVSHLPDTSAQLAFDIVETSSGKILSIECNPRATSGIHLYSGTSHLAQAFTNPNDFQPTLSARLGAKRQIRPGMMMWRADRDKKSRENMPLRKQYLQHMKRFFATKDVTFSWKDIWPTLMQPFLLTAYYRICYERKMQLPTMFQWDVTWEPQGEHLHAVNEMLEELEKKRQNGGDNDNHAPPGGPAATDDSAAPDAGKRAATEIPPSVTNNPTPESSRKSD